MTEALGEMIAPPELMFDGANESDDCANEENAGAAGERDSEQSDTDDESDVEDVFALSTCKPCRLEGKYLKNFLYRWLQAVQELGGHLRDEVLLPLHPEPDSAQHVWTDVDKAVVLPSWHCAFCRCTAVSAGWSEGASHERDLWTHVWTAHRQTLVSMMRKFDLRNPAEISPESEEVAFTLYNEALAEKERQSCPKLGIATDRRALLHLGETFKEDSVKTLMCYVCSCKKMCHEGFGKFGARQQKGDISYRDDEKLLRDKLLTHKDKSPAWQHNCSLKRFKTQFGDAVRTDPHMNENSYEWKRKVNDHGEVAEAMCCPEDVQKSPQCTHDDTFVCCKCRIPVCNECWAATVNGEKIPKALTNDNYIGYAHQFIVEKKVTWLEATIASPVFSGVVTYYVEGCSSKRRNLMDTVLGKAERAWKIRGNLFSFLLPWEDVIRQLYEKCEEGNLSQWPWSPDAICQAVRVKFTNGSETLADKFRDLYVRSRVVKTMAAIYIDNNVAELQSRKGVLHIHGIEQCATIAESLKAHVDRRMNELYPDTEFGTKDGALLPGVREIASTLQGQSSSPQPVESGFDQKQSTMHDDARSVEETFTNMRPSIVVDEAQSAGTFAPEVVRHQTVKNIVDLEVPMSNVLEEQFVTKYFSKIFGYSLNYACGGADYPELFGDWDQLTGEDQTRWREHLKPRFRRTADDPILLPGAYSQMMSTRPEMQVAGDWLVVPSARQLHWRYTVLRSAFMTCTQRLSPGETVNQNLEELVRAIEKIWKRIQAKTVPIKCPGEDGVSKIVNVPLNGDVRKLFVAEGVTAAEKTILRAYLNTTSNIAGCQAIRQKIGHCCFGFRVVHGEVIFVTVSPNRRHSSMILKLSRARRNDTSLRGDDDVSRWRNLRSTKQCLQNQLR